MQLQNKMTKRENSILLLLVDWLIVLGTYLFVRLFFILFGLHLNTAILGGCLAILPYLLGALYLWKSCKQKKGWFYIAAILLPSIVEKAAVYLLGAFLYDLSPANIAGVMDAISSNEQYTNFITNQSARYLINISFFDWTYILCSTAFSVLAIIVLVKAQKKKAVE